MATGGWKKPLFAAFLVLAAVAVILGVIAGVKPEAFQKDSNKSASSSPPVSSSSSMTYDAPAASVPKPVVVDKPSSPITVIEKAVTDTTKPATQTTTGTVQTPATGNTGILAGQNAGKQAVGLINSVVRDDFQNVLSTTGACLASTGAEFVTMMNGATCVLIQLLPGVTYDLGAAEIPVTSRKVVIGNPLNLPILDGSKAPRIFHITAGGYLDLRFVITYRGGGELIATVPVLRGGSVCVEPGGNANLLGCIFTLAPPTSPPPILVAPDLSRATRIFGGQIYLAGGTITMTLCHTFFMTTGVLFREIYVMGIEILIVGGSMTMTGCTLTTNLGFLNVGGLALFAAHLGGIWICSGVTYTLSTAVIHPSGAGLFTFLGGGVAIFSGVTWGGNFGTLATFGAGTLFYVGGGVLVISGSAQEVSSGVSIVCGSGGLTGLGGGVMVYSGVTQAFNSGASFLAEAGVLNWMGGGTATWSGVSVSRNVGSVAAYGVGGTFGVGNGILVATGSPSSDNYGTASIALVGGDYFVGTGILIDIGNPWIKVAGVAFVALKGIHFFVGAGTFVSQGSPGAVQFGIASVSADQQADLAAGDFLGRQYIPSSRRLLANGSSAAVVEESGSAITFLDASPVNTQINNPFVKSVQGATPPAPLQIKAANINGNDTECNLCGTASAADMVGDAVSRCTRDASRCSIETAKTGSGEPLPMWTSAATKMAKGNSKGLVDTQISSAVIKVGCNAQGGANPTNLPACADKAAIKDSLADALGEDCAQIEVSPRNNVGPLTPYLGLDDHALTGTLAASDRTSTFDVFFVSHDASCTERIKDYLDETSTDNTDLMTSLQSTTNSNSKVGINTLSVEQVAQRMVPGMDAQTASSTVFRDTLKASDRGLTPVVLVRADKRLSQPSFTSTQTATVALKNFVKGKDVQLSLTADCGAAGSAGSTPLGSVKYEDPNNEGMRLQVPLAKANVAAGQTKMLAVRAEQAGIGWCSQPFQVSA